MGLYTSFASSVLFPLHERLKHHNTVAVRRRLEETQWWSPQKIDELRLQRLQSLLKAAQQTPYYRSVFNHAGFRADKIDRLDDLERLPTLTKAMIRSNRDDMRHPDAKGLASSSTGGSSGEPLIFLIGKERVSHDVAAKWRATRWWDVDIGDREIVLWGSPIELLAQDWVKVWRDKVFRSTLLSAFDMSERNLDLYLSKIRAKRPKMLFGYPYSLALMARHAQKRGVAMNDLGIKAVFVTSERLYDDQRAVIAQVFGCSVANGYGGRDAGFVAHECPHGGMHITAEDVVVELLGVDARNVPLGEAGEVTVTHLATSAFPFVRYRTGDVAVLHDQACPCGRGLPLLREVQGRTNDFLKSRSGTPIPCGAFTYLLRAIPGIDSFKVIQESIERTRLLVVKGAGLQPAALDEVVRGFKFRLGQDVAVDIEYVDEIPQEKSGKFRYIVSKLT